MLGQSVIILSITKAAHDLLAKKGSIFSDRPRFVMASELALKGMHMLLRPYDARFKLHQRMESQVLNERAAVVYLPFQELESRQLLLDLLKNAGGSGTDCHEYLERTTASIIYALFYGYRLKSASEPVLLAAHAVNHEFDQLAQVGKYLVDSFPVLNNLPSFLAPWKAEAEDHWQRNCALHVGNLQRGLRDRAWNFCKQMGGYLDTQAIEMSPEELALDIGIMADAALDASTGTLYWFLVACVTDDGGFMAEAQFCLDKVVGRDRLPTFEDRPRLPYIDAIVEEVLRWRPAGAAGVPHFTKVGGTYEGYRIPANSVVIANHWAITREEAVFGPDVESFRPSRWLDSINNSGQLRDLPTVGFGYGRRVCPGRHVARNSLWIVIARLLWAFNITPGLSKRGERIEVDSTATTDGLVTKPLRFKATLEPRGEWSRKIILSGCDTQGVAHAEMLDRIGENLAAKSGATGQHSR
ncbi:hypothetical protein JX265_006925 [Neoarthrinium moseri]|uniref:Cytochrome P450 n=1 Tax=Neoarthrinium moseri TaxID=1658444 RepID=A0A9P9WLJ5_9PEZI|nr:hypothetical protein JX265_006925 [Neoarthrinium moseri]